MFELTANGARAQVPGVLWNGQSQRGFRESHTGGRVQAARRS